MKKFIAVLGLMLIGVDVLWATSYPGDDITNVPNYPMMGQDPNGKAKNIHVDSNGNVLTAPGQTTPTSTPTATATPTGTLTPTATPTPLGFSFLFSNSTSTGQTITAAVSGYYNTLRGFSVDDSNSSSAGGVMITDGTVTLWGPITILASTGINVDRTTYSAAMNRPLIFFNSGGVTNMEITGQYSVDLPGVK